MCEVVPSPLVYNLSMMNAGTQVSRSLEPKQSPAKRSNVITKPPPPNNGSLSVQLILWIARTHTHTKPGVIQSKAAEMESGGGEVGAGASPINA
jgi:hypothetical protein